MKPLTAEQLFHTTPLDNALIVALSLLIFISWLYYFFIYSKVRLTKIETSHSALPPISIIVAAKDAKNQLKEHIPLWLDQDYPQFELVIANDRSTDGTALFLTEYALREPRLKVVQMDIDVIKTGGKKLALTLAFKKASFNHFILTDADCRPAGKNWVRLISQQFTAGNSIVLGVSPLNTNGSFLGRLVQYENVLTALSYLGFSDTKKTYMGVGRNLGYTRDAYNSVQGFSNHYHIPAGDDDLFVQEAALVNSVGICIDPEAYTFSDGPNQWKSYWKQKQRHLWVGKNYISSVKYQLFWFPFAQFAFYVLLIWWLALGGQWLIPLTMLVIKWIPEWIIFGMKAKLLKMPKATPIYPLLNVFQALWYFVTGIFAFFKKKIVW